MQFNFRVADGHSFCLFDLYAKVLLALFQLSLVNMSKPGYFDEHLKTTRLNLDVHLGIVLVFTFDLQLSVAVCSQTTVLMILVKSLAYMVYKIWVYIYIHI